MVLTLLFLKIQFLKEKMVKKTCLILILDFAGYSSCFTSNCVNFATISPNQKRHCRSTDSWAGNAFLGVRLRLLL